MTDLREAIAECYGLELSAMRKGYEKAILGCWTLEEKRRLEKERQENELRLAERYARMISLEPMEPVLVKI